MSERLNDIFAYLGKETEDIHVIIRTNLFKGRQGACVGRRNTSVLVKDSKSRDIQH